MKNHHHNGPVSPTPNSTTGIHENIALRAYELWEAYGRPENQADAIWLEAETEQLTGRKRPSTISAGAPPVG